MVPWTEIAEEQAVSGFPRVVQNSLAILSSLCNPEHPHEALLVIPSFESSLRLRMVLLNGRQPVSKTGVRLTP